MQKYIFVAKGAWDEILTYRLSFFLWRLRNVLQFITLYFLWSALIPTKSSLIGYSHSLMLTYVLATSLIGSIVWSSKTVQVGDDINQGNLSNFLLKPMSYIKYWFAKDIGDKAMNITCSCIELLVFILLVKPPLFFQQNIFLLCLTCISIIFATILYFFINFLLGLIAFWSPETWAPRFLFYNVMTFFAGNLFPLDILPKPLYAVSQLLPFQYMLYFPIKLYLGQLSLQEILFGFCVTIFWGFIFGKLLFFVWKRGLVSYAAYGQ